MRRPSQLTCQELLQLAHAVQLAFYVDADEATQAPIWNPDKEWDAAEVCQDLNGILSKLDMIPETRMPFRMID
jgi:hypothetical protein